MSAIIPAAAPSGTSGPRSRGARPAHTAEPPPGVAGRGLVAR
jgi:hypothetical protein